MKYPPILISAAFFLIAFPDELKAIQTDQTEPKIVSVLIESCISQMQLDSEGRKDLESSLIFAREIELALAIQASDEKTVRVRYAYNQLLIQNSFDALKYELLKSKGVDIPDDMELRFQDYIAAKTILEVYSKSLKKTAKSVASRNKNRVPSQSKRPDPFDSFDSNQMPDDNNVRDLASLLNSAVIATEHRWEVSYSHKSKTVHFQSIGAVKGIDLSVSGSPFDAPRDYRISVRMKMTVKPTEDREQLLALTDAARIRYLKRMSENTKAFQGVARPGKRTLSFDEWVEYLQYQECQRRCESLASPTHVYRSTYFVDTSRWFVRVADDQTLAAKRLLSDRENILKLLNRLKNKDDGMRRMNKEDVKNENQENRKKKNTVMVQYSSH